MKFFLPFATDLAKAFCVKIRYPDADEYISVAQEKLFLICKKLKDKKTARSYVRKCINGYLQNHLRDNGRKMKLPRGILDMHNDIRKFRKKNPEATDEQIRGALNITMKEWVDHEIAFSLEFTPLTELIPCYRTDLPKEKLELLGKLDSDLFDELIRVFVDKQPVKKRYAEAVNQVVKLCMQ